MSDLVAEDAGDVEAFSTAANATTHRAIEAALLVIQADGKGVPIVRTTSGRARRFVWAKATNVAEAVVTGLYTIPPHHAPQMR